MFISYLAVLLLSLIIIEAVVGKSSDKFYCDPYQVTGGHPFNFSCLQECYFDYEWQSRTTHYTGPCDRKSYLDSETFIFQYLHMGIDAYDRYPDGKPISWPNRVVDVFTTGASSAITLLSEMDLKFSFNRQTEYTCNLTFATFKKETTFLEKCFHHTDPCYSPKGSQLRNPWYNFVRLSEVHRQLQRYKSCIFNLSLTQESFANISINNPLFKAITAPSGVKTTCNVNGMHIETVEFPMELKGMQYYPKTTGDGMQQNFDFSVENEHPTNDIELKLHVSRVSVNFYAVQLTWTCPSQWNYIPDVYRVVCARVRNAKFREIHEFHDTPRGCDPCWAVINTFDHTNATHVEDCRLCWRNVAGKTNDEMGTENQPYKVNIKQDHYLAFPVQWRRHNTTFFIYNCGTSCEDVTLKPNAFDGAHVWHNTRAAQMGIVCTIKAKNTKISRVGHTYKTGKESDRLAIGMLNTTATQSFLQMTFRKTHAEYYCCASGLLKLELTDDQSLLLLQERNQFQCDAIEISDQLALFPSNIHLPKQNIHNESGCYDWLSQHWYFPVHNEEAALTSFIAYFDQGTYFTIIHTPGFPRQVGCIPSKSIVIWTESFETGSIRLATAKISMAPELNISISWHHSLTALVDGCINCTQIGNLVSEGIHVNQEFGDTYVSVITDTGLWAISMDPSCKCQKVASAEILKQGLNDDLSEVRSFTFFSKKQIGFLNIKPVTILEHSYLNVTVAMPSSVQLLVLPDSWYNITKSHKTRLEVHTDLLGDLPGYPSHWLQTQNITDHFVNNRNCPNPNFEHYKIQSVSDNFFNTIPDDCIFMDLNQLEPEFKMLSETTAMFTIQAVWVQSAHCRGFVKPPGIYRVQYGIFPDIANSSNYSCTAEMCPCEAPNSGCRKTEMQYRESGPTSITIAYLIPHQNYLVEIAALLRDLMVSVGSTIPAEVSADIQQTNQKKIRQRTFMGMYRTDFAPERQDLTAIFISIGLLGVLALILISIVIYAYKRRWYMYRNLNRINPRDIKRQKKLGEGHFGEVWEAVIVCGHKSTSAAIKQLNEAAGEKEKRQFLEEAILLSKLNHPNIVKSLGICMSSKPVTLALEFLNGGSLQHFLIKRDVRTKLCVEDLFHITTELCKACVHLEQMGYIHRDISAKNCLISLSPNSVNPKKVKLADFGLAKDTAQQNVYMAALDAVIPVPYTAPEGLIHGNFTSKGDVWSFGVLIWEVFSWAARPFGKCCYPENERHLCPLKEHAMSQIEFIICVEKKTLNDLKDPCCAIFSDPLKKLMGECWQFDAEFRPNFKQLHTYLQALLKTSGQIGENTMMGARGTTGTEAANVGGHKNDIINGQQPSKMNLDVEKKHQVKMRDAYSDEKPRVHVRMTDGYSEQPKPVGSPAAPAGHIGAYPNETAVSNGNFEMVELLRPH